MFVVVADALQLTAARELPGEKLQASPQTLAVEEHKELGHHSGEEKEKKKNEADAALLPLHLMVLAAGGNCLCGPFLRV